MRKKIVEDADINLEARLEQQREVAEAEKKKLREEA